VTPTVRASIPGKSSDYTFPRQTVDWFWMPDRMDPNTIRMILSIIYFQLWTKSGREMPGTLWRQLWSCLSTGESIIREQRSLRKWGQKDWGEHPIQPIHQISAPVTSGHSEELKEW
jgi:hypothetical protein